MLKAGAVDGHPKVLPRILTRSRKAKESTIVSVVEPVIKSLGQKRKRNELKREPVASRESRIISRSHSDPLAPLRRDFTVLVKEPLSQQIGALTASLELI